MSPTRARLAAAVFTTCLSALTWTGCERAPRAIRHGHDECGECRMSVVDRHYGAVHLTARGKTHVFDDVSCLLAFLRRTGSGGQLNARTFVVEFSPPHRLLPAEQARFLLHPRLRSPMAGNIGAFASPAELDPVRRELGTGGRELGWLELQSLSP